LKLWNNSCFDIEIHLLESAKKRDGDSSGGTVELASYLSRVQLTEPSQ